MKSNERGLDKFFQELSTYVPITLKLTALILHTKYIYGIQYDESAHWIINGIDDAVQWGLIILSVPTILTLFYKVFIQDFLIPIGFFFVSIGKFLLNKVLNKARNKTEHSHKPKNK